MRLAIICSVLALASIGYSQQRFATKAFTDQNFHSKEWKKVERFGKSETDIVRMGHDGFVAWYCDGARGGKDARIQAEKVYCLALNESSAPLLLKLSHKEQLAMESIISALADMAKSSFVAGIEATGDNHGWSLPIAESSTAVAATVYAMLNPNAPATAESTPDLQPLFDQLNERLKAKKPPIASDGERLKFLVGYLDKLFKDRSERDKSLARSFSEKMAKMALFQPE